MSDPTDTPVRSPRSVLLLAPGFEPEEGRVCTDLLTDDGGPVAVCWITFTPLDRQVARWREYVSYPPESFDFVSVGNHASRSDVPVYESMPAGSVTERTIRDPGDLTGIGIETSKVLAERADGDAPVVVCFDSLTPLLQYADLKRTYRFVNVFGRRLATLGIGVHYHLDPEAHDQRTVSTLRHLFPEVIDLREAADHQHAEAEG